MNVIRESMEKIRATEELKQTTLRYLNERCQKRSIFKAHAVPKYVLAALCLVFVIGLGGYSVYGKPVSFISIDVNPSIELGVNRFGQVVAANAYNEDGESILKNVSLKNVSYMQAIVRILEDESENGFLSGDSGLVFTIVSDNSKVMLEKITKNELFNFYGAQAYIADQSCMQEAHRHNMSFGKYRAYMELSEYDQSITVEDCHGMTMGEIQDKIETCRGHGGTMNEGNHSGGNQNGHGGHHGNGH